MIMVKSNMPPYIFIAAAALLVGIFFSYQPTLSFGTASGTNLEVSAAQIGAAVFIFASLSLLWRNRTQLYHNVSIRLLSGLAAFSTLSLLYTPNLTRGVLFTTLLWAIVALWAAITVSLPAVTKYIPQLRNIVFCSIILTTLFAWFQIFAEAFGVSPSVTLLPAAYLSGVFGFARPTAFALEPQFLGSLLIAPVLYCAYLELVRRQTIFSRIIFFVSLSVLLATISRGAYLSAAAGMVMIIIAYGKTSLKASVWLAGYFAITAIATIGLLGVAAHINQRDQISGDQAVAKSINQLSFGVIDLSAPEVPISQPLQAPATQPSAGYVATSTDSRLGMAEAAWKLWTLSPSTILFGVGSGGFGATLHASDARYAENSIVNNQYLEVLVELGLIGLLLLVSVIGY